VKRAYKFRIFPTSGQAHRATQCLRDHQRLYNVYLQGIGHVKVHAHRAARSRVKTITLKREGRRWYIVLSCDDVPVQPLPATGREIGLDVGVTRFATTSDGEVIDNPRLVRESADEMAAAQQVLARKKRGSSNRKRARCRVAELHRRADFHHKTARALVESCDAIALEDLPITNMTRSAAGTLAEPGTNVAAKSGLNRSILDAGWGQFMNIIVAKAEEAGRQIVFVDPRYTSINCHECGMRCTRPRQDTVICPVHGAMDADVNGARNIYARAGLGSGQAHAA
jgi:putative transposase